MPLAYNVDNYSIGKAKIFFKKEGTTGYLDLGNCPKIETKPETTKEEHYSSREGIKLKDFTPITEKKVMGSFDIEEFSIDNLMIAFTADAVSSSLQTAGTLDGVSVSLVDDRFVALPKRKLYYSALHGDITGAFVPGTTVEDGTSFTMDVIEVGASSLKGVNTTGTIVPGTTAYDGSDTSISILVTAFEANVPGVLLADSGTQASITENYVLNTDFDTEPESGMVRKLSDGDIPGATAYAYADYEAKTIKSITILEGSKMTGELLIVGTADIGPRLEVRHWKCELTANGALPMVSDGIASFGIDFEVLADTTNHPSNPFGYIREIS